MNILQQMFGDQTEVFLDTCWPKRSYVADGAMSRFTQLSALEEFQDIRQLFNALPGPVDLLFPGGKRITVARSADALAPYNDGAAMVYIKDLEALPRYPWPAMNWRSYSTFQGTMSAARRSRPTMAWKWRRTSIMKPTS
ncbi:hypothetical protein THH46_10965 [Pseudomonas sp. NA13]